MRKLLLLQEFNVDIDVQQEEEMLTEQRGSDGDLDSQPQDSQAATPLSDQQVHALLTRATRHL